MEIKWIIPENMPVFIVGSIAFAIVFTGIMALLCLPGPSDDFIPCILGMPAGLAISYAFTVRDEDRRGTIKVVVGILALLVFWILFAVMLGGAEIELTVEVIGDGSATRTIVYEPGDDAIEKDFVDGYLCAGDAAEYGCEYDRFNGEMTCTVPYIQTRDIRIDAITSYFEGWGWKVREE